MKWFVSLSVLVLLPAMQAHSETLILWSPAAKACGPNGYTYRAGYSIESVDPAKGTTALEKLKARIAEGKAAGAREVYTATIPPNSCVAIAYMDKKVGTCEWRTFTWKVAGDAATAQAAVEKVLAKEVNLKNSGVQEVRCAMPPQLPKNKDTAWAIRG